MGTISNYVEEEQTPLTSDNYNEVDGAVFAELTYFTFENRESFLKDDAQISVSDYAREILENPSTYKDEALSADETAFLEALANSERYSNCTMSNFEYNGSLTLPNEKGEREIVDSQWAAYTVDINDGTDTSVVAMRGTDGTTLGWKEDFELAYDVDGTNAQRLSAEYMKQVDSSNIFMTGHSKGGNDVISAYAMSDSEIRDRVSRIDNYDGPGVNEGFKSEYSEGYAELAGKLNSYYPENSVIGRLLIDKDGNYTYVDADVRPDFQDKGFLGEHDLFAFVVGEGGSFSEAEATGLSNFLNTTLDQVVENLSPKQLENLVNVLDRFEVFSLIAGDGQNSYANIDQFVEAMKKAGDPLGIIPDSVKDVLGGISKIGLNAILIGMKCITMTPKEIAGLISTIAVFAEMGIQKLADKLVDVYYDVKEKVKTKISNVINSISDIFSDIKDAFVDKFNEIKNGILSTLDSFTSTVVNYFKEAYNTLSDIVNSVLGKGNHMFSINLSAIKAESAKLKQISRKLDRQVDRLRDVNSEIDKLRFGINTAALTALIVKLESERKDCDELAETLEQIVEIYRNTEKRICAQA